jgi:hypothetical protein
MGVAYSHISPEEQSKNESLNYVRQKYIQQWESGEDIPYADSIYKIINDVVEHQLDKMADMELEDFYRAGMQKYYEDKRNAIEFNDAWMDYKDCECRGDR